MLQATFRPLEQWPGPPTKPAMRQRSPFDSTYDQTLQLLERELAHLGATGVVIQVEAPLSQFKNGWLRSVNAVTGPAAIVSFLADDSQRYSYPCDTFADYKSNLRAIALALEALRKVDRYGVTSRGEQYQGFRALPPPAETTQRKMEPGEAAAFLAQSIPGVEPTSLLMDKALFETILKLAQKRMHPDGGGNHEDFIVLQDAAAVLMEHFKP